MKRMTVSVLALAIAAAAGSALAAQDYGNGNGYDSNRNGAYDSSYNRNSSRNDIATVVSARPIYSQGQAYQRQECWNEQTNNYDDGYYRDGNGRLYRNGQGQDSNTNGTLIGALIGGALGNQAGKGDGKKAATLGGAVVGGLIGNKMDRNNNSEGSYDQYRDNSGVVRRCRTVVENGGGGMSGYDVTYRYAGQMYHATTSYRPGRTIRVVVNVRPQDDNGSYGR